MRNEWITFLTSGARLSRYLALSGESLRQTTEKGPEDDELRRFLGQLTVNRVDRDLLLRAHFLFREELLHFVNDALPKLLRSLHHEAHTSVTYGGRGIRGRILWSPTSRARAAGRLLPGSYVTQNPERTANVPENQLLVVFLRSLFQAISDLERIIGTGSLGHMLLVLKDGIERALSHAALKKIDSPNGVSATMRLRAFRHRNRAYRVVADLQQQLEESLLDDKWTAIAKLLSDGWFAPISDDDLFELYLLCFVIDVIVQDCEYEVEALGLLRRGRNEVARLRKQDSRLKIYFDYSPRAVGLTESRYTRLIRSYDGISGNERRPDILVESQTSAGRHVLMIEAKKTSDGPYIRDSIYKVFGYLYDFAALWRSSADTRPRALLVFPDSVKQSAPVQSDILLMGGADRDTLARQFRG